MENESFDKALFKHPELFYKNHREKFFITELKELLSLDNFKEGFWMGEYFYILAPIKIVKFFNLYENAINHVHPDLLFLVKNRFWSTLKLKLEEKGSSIRLFALIQERIFETMLFSRPNLYRNKNVKNLGVLK